MSSHEDITKEVFVENPTRVMIELNKHRLFATIDDIILSELLINIMNLAGFDELYYGDEDESKESWNLLERVDLPLDLRPTFPWLNKGFERLYVKYLENTSFSNIYDMLRQRVNVNLSGGVILRNTLLNIETKRVEHKFDRFTLDKINVTKFDIRSIINFHYKIKFENLVLLAEIQVISLIDEVFSDNDSHGIYELSRIKLAPDPVSLNQLAYVILNIDDEKVLEKTNTLLRIIRHNLLVSNFDLTILHTYLKRDHIYSKILLGIVEEDMIS